MATRLKRATYFWTPVTNPMHHRPMESRMTGDTVNRFAEATHGGTATGIENLSGVAGSFMAPSIQSRGVVDIENGWSQGRFAVAFEFETRDAVTHKLDILTGYTNYDGISSQEHFDPEMEIFFDNHVVARPTNMHLGGRGVSTFEADANRQLLRPLDVITHGAMGSPQHVRADVMLRPQDTMAYLHRENYFLNDGMGADTVDSRSMINAPYVSTRRDVNIPSHYLANVLNAHKASTAANYEFMSSEFGGDSTPNISGFMAANPMIMEDDGRGSTLINRLIQETAYGAGQAVTIAEIERCWPEHVNGIGAERMVVLPKPGSMTNRTGTEDWGVASPKSALAYSITHIVPAIMGRQLLMGYGFTMTNRTMGGLDGVRLQFGVTNAQFLSEHLPDKQRRLALAEEQLKIELMGAIMGQESVGDFFISVEARSLHTIDIKISVNGEHYMTEYSAPAYCSNLYTSVIGSGEQSIKNLSNDLSRMLDDLYGTTSNTVQY